MELADKQLMQQIEQLIDSNELSPFFRNFNGGQYVQEFEHEFSRYVGSKYAVSMANGTLALNAAYTALDLKHGGIIVSPWTFVATVSEIIRSGHTPLFADVNRLNGGIDHESVQELASSAKAFVLMHPLGSPCDIDLFRQFS